MSFALSAGVTGLQAHQTMLDVAGNNLANINTTAFKSSRVTFSELLCETIRKASAPTANTGGTNPQQMGSGVSVSGISPNMSQGNIMNTGDPLHLAIEGGGYFSLSDGQKTLYTRAGAFAVDADSNLVDPATGYRVQRIGSTGESEGFQAAGNSDIQVPYDVSMPAKATTQITVQGNLSADATFPTTQTQVINSNIAYTTSSGAVATGSTKIADLAQYTGTLTSGTITFSGYEPDGTALSSATPSVDLTMDIDANTTLDDVLTHLNTDDGASNELVTISSTGTGGTFNVAFGTTAPLNVDIDFDATAADVKTALETLGDIAAGDVSCTCTGTNLTDGDIIVEFTGNLAATDVAAMVIDNTNLTGGTASVDETNKGKAVQGVLGGHATASLSNGKIVITDATSGYSQTDLAMAWSGDGTLTMPAYFEMTKVGGEEVKNINITTYDTLGGKHVISGAIVRTDTANTWDMVLTSITGDIHEIALDDRRIQSIEFDETNGSFKGLNTTVGDSPEFVVTFKHDTASPQTMTIEMGTAGQFDGLTQFAGNSTAVARDQDGYEAGMLSAVSVDNEGTVIGSFTNGIKRDIATIQIALFQNPAALESAGGGYFLPSANSGNPIDTQAVTGGAGKIHGGSLEKSNADIANEFVAMIQAQNGFQANARTIRVANDILRELTSLIR